MVIIQSKGMAAAVARMQRTAGARWDREISAALLDIGLMVQRDAKAFAPRSPTKGQYRTTLKTPNFKSKAILSPGGLENSIEQEVHGTEFVEIFVPLNSLAGKYAKKMHDGRGKSWQNRGVGTKAKGTKAGDKYISRAIQKDRAKIVTRIQKALAGMVK